MKRDFYDLLRASEELDKSPREEDFDVADLMTAISRNVMTQYPFAIVIDELEPELYHVQAIPNELGNVVWNVVTNGLEAMAEDAKLTIRARNHVDEEQKRWVEIEIEDTGSGIPEDEVSSVFKLFYTTKGEDRGYGLWRAKSVIDRLGGKIRVRSEVNVGSTFTIVLPATPSEA
jgi:signal transduction histidine kinase